jgi:hypothetical protein
MGAASRTAHHGRLIQRREFFQRGRHHRLLEPHGLHFKIPKDFAFHRLRRIGRNHSIQLRLKKLPQPFPSLLPRMPGRHDVLPSMKLYATADPADRPALL